MYRVVLLVCCVFVSVSGAYNSTDGGDLQDCDNVREHFKLIGNVNLVPEKPHHAENLHVCSASHSRSEKSCCSSRSEGKYVTAAEHYIREYLRSKTSHLGGAVSRHIHDYTDALTNVMKHAERSLGSKLTDWYSIPHGEHQHAISQLFTDIQDYVYHKNVVLEVTVKKFFDTIFPVIFKHVIYHQSTETWTHKYHHCLTNQRSAIRPSPFGKYPDIIEKKLSYGLSLMRTYLQAMSVVVETVNTTNNLTWGDQCVHAMTRMKFCSHCDGLVGIQPCYGLCYNVMNGCFSRVAEIGRDWQEMMKHIEALVLEMSEKRINKVFKEMLVGISEAFMHSMVTATDFYGQVHDLCGVPIEQSADREPNKGPTFSKGTGDQEEASPFPFMSMMQITLQLVDSKRMFLNLGLDLCPKQLDDPSKDLECWNGTELSGYMADMVDRDILNQARNNPEMKVSLTLDPELRRLKTNITETNFALQAHTRKTPKLRPSSLEIADDPFVYEGSGASKKGTSNVQYSPTLGDDEDLSSYTSGSGSGVEEDNEVVTEKIQVVFPDGNQGHHPTYGDGGQLGPDTSKKDPPREPKDSPRAGAANIQISGALLLSTVLLWICFDRR